MKIHEYNEMMAHLTRRRSMSNGGSAGFRGILADKTGMKGTTEAARKLLQLLSELKPGDSFNQSDLARKSGASRTLVGTYLKNFFPQLGSGTGRTEKDYSKFKQKVEARDQKVLDKGFLEDYKKKVQSTKGYADSSLSNKALAKKYYPELTETAGIARLEKLARKIREDNPELTYKKMTPKEFEQRRKSRLLLTQAGKQFGGTDKFPFHHIMPIGGAETDITTKDVTFISKKMNSKLAPFNKKLNGIADGISGNLANYASTKDDKFLKRVDDLNKQALQIVDKTKKKLPKKFQGLIGFNKVTPILDENATLINTSVERIGIDEAKSIVGREGPKIPLKDLPGTRSKASLLKKIKAAQSKGTTLGSTMIQPELANLDTPAAKNLFSSAGKIALGELGFAGPSVVLDTYAGLTPSEMALNVATFGFGTSIKDSVQKRKYISEAGFGSDYSSALTKRRNLRTAPEDAVGQLTEKEKQAIFLANAFDAGLDLQRAERAAGYQQRQQSQLKRGELEIPDYTEVPEATTSIQPEFKEETTETRSLPFGLDRLLPFDDEDEII